MILGEEIDGIATDSIDSTDGIDGTAGIPSVM